MRSWSGYDADFEARISRYREGARALRGAAGTMSADLRGDFLKIATELEGLTDDIAGLWVAITEMRSSGNGTGTR